MSLVRSYRLLVRALNCAGPGRALRAFALCGAIVFPTVAMLPVSAALSQTVSAVATAERERDYGRMRLEFRDRLDLPAYEIDVENGVLRVVFEEPVETDIRDAMRVLDDFVTIARRDPDGMALRFGLSRAVRINTMEAGETLFIDFLPNTWQGFPPPLPEDVVERLAERAEQAAREAAEAERRRLLGELEPEVSLRVGAAPTFTRYAFSWNVPFNATVEQQGSSLTVRFDYDVPVDLTAARIDMPAELESIDYERDGASLAVTLDVVAGTQLRWFEDDLRFNIDVTRDRPLDPQEAEQAELDALIGQIGGNAGTDNTQFSALGQRSDDVVQAAEPPSVTVQSGDLANVTLSPASGEAVAAGDVSAGGEPVAGPVDPAGGEPVDRQTLLVRSDDDVQANGIALLQRPDVASADSLVTGRRPVEVSERREEEALPETIRVEVRPDGETTRLMFPFTHPTPAAVFRRGSVVTMVFETNIPFDLRAVRIELADIAHSITASRSEGGTVIHVDMRDEQLVSMAPSGDRWIVLLGPAVIEPAQPLFLGRSTQPDGKAFAELVAEGLGTVQVLDHPHVGDTLYVVPMLGPARGALARQDLVEFSLLSSTHGVVVRPKVDELEAVVEDGTRLLLSREQGLSLSEVGLSLGSFGFSPDDRPGYFDLRAFAGQGPGAYEDSFAAYQRAIAFSEGVARGDKMLEFARFLLAFGMGQEANGMLDIAVSENTALEHDPAFLTLRAAGWTAARRFQEASDIVRSHAMEGVEDGRFWALFADAGLRDWAHVNAEFDDVSALFDGYPASLVTQARMIGVEAAIEVQALDVASDRLRQINPTTIPDRLRARFELLHARLDLARGRYEDAIAGFERVKAMDPGPDGALATLLSIEGRIEFATLSRSDGVEELENLAVAWRGDDTEIRTRALLGDLYIEDGRFADALRALKGVLIAQPDHPMAASVSDQMTGIFVSLFLDGEADRLPAIDALSLFYDFRELTPIGRRGDELVRRLADRLVEIDLLDQAADLLQHQVDNRLTGSAKAQIAADLALIYLMDYRPAEAVATLQRSRVSQAPRAIERVRRIIEARALSELARHDLALEMLRSMEGEDVDRVRADVLWNAQRWQDAGEVIERSLGERWRDRVPFDEHEMQQVLRTAIAYSFANDAYSLRRLRARFDAKMTDGVYASAFDVVTAPIESHGTAFRDVARSIAGLNTLNRFLDDYRATFSSQALVPTVPPGA